jgi:hypothetical protein
MASPLPPKPKKETPDDLAEVERALSILKGRHPEHERLQREDQERRAKRDAARAVVQKGETRKLRSRQAVLVAGGAVVLGAVSVIVLSLRREIGRRAGLDQVTEPWRGAGFAVLESSSRGDPSKLEASAPEGCVLAIATGTKPVKLKITTPVGSVEGEGSVLTCLCEAAPVTVIASGTPMPPGEGLVLLRTDTAVLGGSRAFPFLPFTPGATGKTDQACADASLEAWIDAKRWRGEPPSLPPELHPRKAPRVQPAIDPAGSDRWLGGPARSPLKNAGFRLASLLDPRAPFVAVEVPKESCVLVLPERDGDRTTVRTKGTTLVGPAANLAWCASSEALAIVQRDGEGDPGGAGEVGILVAPAARIGGLLGLSEIARAAGVTLAPEAALVGGADHGWNARELLLASAIPETLISLANAPDLGTDPEARIIALSVDKPGTLTSDSPDGVFSFCAPPIDRSTGSLCVFSGAQKWRLDGAQAAGLARAKLPFWLFALQSVSEPAGLKVETELIALARRLRRDGFEPTTIEAVTEVDKGAEVLGRANEDAMVVVGLAPTDPWVFPYSDGAPWTLGGEPRVVPIKPLERITVTTTARLPAKATRRTIVFRRQKHAG